MDLTLLLKTGKLFADLDDPNLVALQQIATRRELRKGQPVFREGQPSRGFFLAVSGGVKIFRLGPDGRERVLHVIEPGETFAEAALFMDTYPADAEALVNGTTVIQLDKTGFRNLLARDPKFSAKIFAALVQWLRDLRDAVTDLTLKEVPARFASYVLSLPADATGTVRATASKTTVAHMIGTTKETFSRLLNRLGRRRILTWRGTALRILNRPRLEAIARNDERI
jgi:CRP/FNR family transcriptional regulator